jgi:hypothetical protein
LVVVGILGSFVQLLPFVGHVAFHRAVARFLIYLYFGGVESLGFVLGLVIDASLHGLVLQVELLKDHLTLFVQAFILVSGGLRG